MKKTFCIGVTVTNLGCSPPVWDYGDKILSRNIIFKKEAFSNQFYLFTVHFFHFRKRNFCFMSILILFTQLRQNCSCNKKKKLVKVVCPETHSNAQISKRWEKWSCKIYHNSKVESTENIVLRETLEHSFSNESHVESELKWVNLNSR